VSTASRRSRPSRNPLFPLGVTYHPVEADSAPRDRWYPGDVDGDLAEFAAARLTLVRIFISWRLFEPQVGVYSDETFHRLFEIVQSAGAHRLRLIVCFFADEPHAGLLEVPWGQNRDPRTDAYLIERQAALVRQVVEAHRSDRAVFAWELGNESFCTRFASAADLERWSDAMRSAVRDIDPDRPVMLAADPETLFHETRVDARETLERFEIGVCHATPAYRSYVAEGPPTRVSATYLDSFLLHAGGKTRPVLLDEVGVHGQEASHAEEAALLRCALYSGLMNGASGALVRRWRDVETERREPYHVDRFESLVGVKDTEGRPKAAMRELDAFARMVARLDLRGLSPVQERAAVVMPSERMSPQPGLPSLFAPRSCLEAFVRAKEAHLPVTVTREEDPFGPYSMLVVPSVTDLAEGTWPRLAEWVQRGGSLVFSYGGGELGPEARDLFGVDFLGHGGARTKATCRVAQRSVLGDLESFEVAAEVPHFALLGPGASTVIATDAAGSPLVTLSRPGQGRAVLIAAPFERVLGQAGLTAAPPELQAFLTTLYGAVGEVAGCRSKVRCDARAVEVALLVGDAEDVVLLLNHDGSDVTPTLSFDRTIDQVSAVEGGPAVSVGGPSFGVPLQPFGAAAFRVRYR